MAHLVRSKREDMGALMIPYFWRRAGSRMIGMDLELDLESV